MDPEQTLLLNCPKCDIPIDVKVNDCVEGREFACAICGEVICFQFPPEEMERIIQEAMRRQERWLKKEFRLTFGDV